MLRSGFDTSIEVKREISQISCGALDRALSEVALGHLRWGARILNSSWVYPSWRADHRIASNAKNRQYDDSVRDLFVTAVLAVGNDGDRPDTIIGAPAAAYNPVTVGALDDRGTVWFTDDVIRSSSSFVDPRVAAWRSHQAGDHGSGREDHDDEEQLRSMRRLAAGGQRNQLGRTDHGGSCGTPDVSML